MINVFQLLNNKKLLSCSRDINPYLSPLQTDHHGSTNLLITFFSLHTKNVTNIVIIFFVSANMGLFFCLSLFTSKT